MSLLAGTFLFSLVGGVVPFLNVEAYLVSVSALAPGASVWPVALAAALGQMAAKSLLYLGGRGLLRLPMGKTRARIEAATVRLATAEGRSLAIVTTSAVVGVPPFYAISVAAGVVRLRFAPFLALGLTGRLVRFAAVFVLPRLL